VLIAAIPALILLLLVEDRSTVLREGLARGAPPAKSPPPAKDPEPSSGLLFSGDFETGDLSQWEGAQRADPGRVTVVTRPVDQGRFSGRFEVRKGDSVAKGSGNGNRAEVLARRQDGDGVWPDREGTERYYGWSTYFPRNYPVVRKAWQTFVQWKNKGSGSSPIAMGIYNGRMHLHAKVRGGPAGKLWKAPLVRGRWQRFVMHVKWSPDPRVGFVELWHNGRRVLPRRYRPTMYRERDGQVLPNYLKQGLYRSSGIVPPQIVYHDGMRIGRSFAEVAPKGATAPRASTPRRRRR